MTPAQAKKVFGRTTVRVVLHGSDDIYWWSVKFFARRVTSQFVPQGDWKSDAAARRHAREFFKKLGLKVRFGK